MVPTTISIHAISRVLDQRRIAKKEAKAPRERRLEIKKISSVPIPTVSDRDLDDIRRDSRLFVPPEKVPPALSTEVPVPVGAESPNRENP